ncbi:hypothetical protein EYR36_002032 [Pleurotus pulmonarius]|nr:hypothetical protein EYR36_002032 [Pleurotus pulmonarius]
MHQSTSQRIQKALAREWLLPTPLFSEMSPREETMDVLIDVISASPPPPPPAAMAKSASIPNIQSSMHLPTPSLQHLPHRLSNGIPRSQRYATRFAVPRPSGPSSKTPNTGKLPASMVDATLAHPAIGASFDPRG